MSRSARDPFERFWEKVDATGDCWEWTGALQRGGYGAFWDGQSMALAHRVAYEMLIGPIPDGLQIDHLCKNRKCVNPDHLEPVTFELNRLRGEYGKAAQAAKRNLTHCQKGHPYSGENLYMASDGKRQCKECKRNWAKAKRASKAVDVPHFEFTIKEIR